jgi:hypothetical protein
MRSPPLELSDTFGAGHLEAAAFAQSHRRAAIDPFKCTLAPARCIPNLRHDLNMLCATFESHQCSRTLMEQALLARGACCDMAAAPPLRDQLMQAGTHDMYPKSPA